MTSRTSDKSYNAGRRIRFLAAGIVIVGLLYTGGWYYLANMLETRVATNIAGLQAKGINAACENAGASGYPFRLGLNCSSVSWVDQAKNVSVHTGAFRSAAQIYAPFHIVSEVDSPASVSVPGMAPLDLNWDNLKSSVRLDKPIPRRLSVEGRNVVINQHNPAGAATPLATLKDGQVHFRAIEPVMDIALSFSSLKIADNTVYDKPLPELTGAADIQLANGFALIGKPERDLSVLRGQSGMLRRVDLALPDGSGIAISGPFSVADDGRISGDFKITMRNPESVASTVKSVLPGQEKIISSVVQAMAFVPKDASGAPTLPVTVKNGKMSVGFISIGRLPSL
ncbi:DUF2125 domain-containing protein [Phyllobacterium sp. OV277]|uniref:DUF2125 domain-containing protein n=1 Tax=Phyllobacterium sp. OV277 TaxID=1882772 RepID=UPI00088110A9|nr:DUF2125 domain-containing protein [Phyllobacterium sp. OV277]SDO80743.1 hypothetical protein SAMN05443582_1021122 [Phyllobacterium sp. OV277]